MRVQTDREREGLASHVFFTFTSHISKAASRTTTDRKGPTPFTKHKSKSKRKTRSIENSYIGSIICLIEETLMMIRSKEKSRNQSSFEVPITASTFTTWKLYENPYYNSQFQQQKQEQQHQQELNVHTHNPIHRLHLPISTRKIASSFWDLTFIKPFMESELDVARAQIIELKADLDYERKARKKLESSNKRLVKQLSAERKRSESVERLYKQLASEIASEKAEINRVKLEMQEERKMLRIAEVLREERVQMKLTEAKMMLEEKFLELKATKQMQIESSLCSAQAKIQKHGVVQQMMTNEANDFSGEITTTARCVNDVLGDHHKSERNEIVQWMQRRASGEPENPHIKRGIKGFVEFPKVIRAIGSKSRHLGTKLEYQKSQLMILFKQKSIVRSDNLIVG